MICINGFSLSLVGHRNIVLVVYLHPVIVRHYESRVVTMICCKTRLFACNPNLEIVIESRFAYIILTLSSRHATKRTHTYDLLSNNCAFHFHFYLILSNQHYIIITKSSNFLLHLLTAFQLFIIPCHNAGRIRLSIQV